MSEPMQFQAEVSRLLDIVANALYSEKEIFLRELISNASDACDRLRYEAIAKPDLLAGDAVLKISISFDATARTIKISDNGIGMNKDDLIKNLGTIAHSGTREVLSNIKDKKDVNLIGQFGVGFYSAFMVAGKVQVLSKKAGDAVAWQWVSDGRGSYTIDEHVKDLRGTEIILHLKDEAGEYLLEERLKQIIKKYSDHISFPISLGEGAEAPVINKASALWVRSKSDVSLDEYQEFYHHVSDTLPTDKPFLTAHWRAEGAIEYNNLLFIPSMKPFDLYDPRRHHGVKLFVKRVFITNGLEGLIPPFLRFVKGVVDSEDLPLNISREMLQNNPIVTKMSMAITRKILSELEDKAQNDAKGFEQFWSLFGAVLKEGLYDAAAHRDALLKVVRFYSTKAEGLTSLDEYIARMKPEQKNIYYIAAGDIMAAKNSPQLEAFKAEGIEVLFMTDTIDEFWIPMQSDYQGKIFKSVTRGKVDLPTSDKKQEPEKTDTTDQLITRLKEILVGEVKDVALSQRLVDSPVCLVAPENDVDIHMQRMLKKSQGYDAATKHILEINGKHPVILKMQEMIANDASPELLRDTAFLLLDQAKIIEGEPLTNPAEFVRRMSRALEKGLV